VAKCSQSCGLRHDIDCRSKHLNCNRPQSSYIPKAQIRNPESCRRRPNIFPNPGFGGKEHSISSGLCTGGTTQVPPVSQLRERVVPPAGDVIDGYRIPGGTFIGFNAWGTQLDRVFGEDPEEFRPERWLINDQDQLKKMHQTHELIFGYGATKCLGMPMAMIELNKVIFEVGCEVFSFVK